MSKLPPPPPPSALIPPPPPSALIPPPPPSNLEKSLTDQAYDKNVPLPPKGKPSIPLEDYLRNRIGGRRKSNKKQKAVRKSKKQNKKLRSTKRRRA
jgi:hypothetical protein